MSPEAIRAELKQMDNKPASAFVAIPVAAAHDGVCEKHVRRHYPLVTLGARKKGVPISYLRNRRPQPAA